VFEGWGKAKEDEIMFIEKNRTCELVEKLKYQRSIGVRWVYRKKLNLNGSKIKIKTRLVVQGYFQ